MKSRSRGLCGVLALFALGACATRYGPESLETGAPLNEVTAALGSPTGRHAHAGGERIEYAHGPYGLHTYMLDFDAQGRFMRWQQVLVEPVVGMDKQDRVVDTGCGAEPFCDVNISDR
jgi:hypothetical protein